MSNDTKGENKEPVKKTKKGCCGLSYDSVLMVANFIMVALTTPYIFYSLQVYNYIQEHAATEAGPDFTFKPDLRDLWITVISAICIRTAKVIVKDYSQPLIR